MKIRYLGHSCFLFDDGKTRILTDPFSGIGYEMPDVRADYVTVSHDHFDHNHVSGVRGVKEIFTRPGKLRAGDVAIEGVACLHDDAGGRKRGKVVAYTFDFGGIKVCHLGDLGEAFSEERAAAFGHPDILLIPVGGTYTIDAAQAVRYIEAIRPKVVIPMHYKTEECALDISPLSGFAEAYGKEKFVGPLETLDTDNIGAYTGKAVVMEVSRRG